MEYKTIRLNGSILFCKKILLDKSENLIYFYINHYFQKVYRKMVVKIIVLEKLIFLRINLILNNNVEEIRHVKFI